ncbi:peptidylprolyl isomerase [Lipingzhangella halophila]|uniref:Peptidyl-prolyl cis-trans isomerase n=1 Tax=Lipingzhangella halophila TaxID=1783352 RepID=A0A7W7W0W4_9ACTN|nr:FKBP-type peptidyl-prolyl cis-trans isomerase [Lipingzhangella halophila]MBB4930016.1 peptidylprolyl isomerase [Lipingzhangella halophila]
MMRRTLLAGITALPLVVSCSPDVPQVSGEFGDPPTIEAPSTTPDEAAHEVAIDGDGPKIDEGSLIAVQLLTHPVAESGELEDPIASSFEQDSETLLTHSEFTELFPEDDGPDGLRVGSRVVNVLPAGETDGRGGDGTSNSALISVMDIVDAYPSDAEVSGTPDEDLALDNGVDLSDPSSPAPQDGAQPPEQTRALPLVKGDGPEIPEQGQLVVQFRGLTWEDGTVFDTTWQGGQPPIALPLGQDAMIDAWDTALPGHTVGSRLLLLVPPEEGYGPEGNPDVGISPNESLIYVIDILGVH